MSDALPLIKNASPLRLKLMAMAVGETIEISPQELPPSYKTVKPIATKIQKGYGYYFAVFKLSAQPGWKVLRVNNAEEADSYVPKKKKARGGRTDEPVRLYNMTDAKLIQLIIEKVAFATRDIADLIPYGITLAAVNQLHTDAFTFAALPGDVQMLAAESEATKAKDEAHNTLLSRLGKLRNMADNTFGSGSLAYEIFDFEGMAGEEDRNLVSRAKYALREGTANQPAMAAWGCTLAFLDLLKTDIETFETKIIDMRAAEADRKKATLLRVTTGNDLYTRTDKICNTGKDVYREISEAKYNDYLIYS